MDNLFYWIIEYLKVMFGYGFVMFIWPSIVFRKYLKGKSLTFRFGFCVTVPIVIMNTVVLMFGILHILNRFTIMLFFFGLLIFSFKENLKLGEQTKRKIKYLFTGTLGWKQFLLLIKENIFSKMAGFVKQFKKNYKKNWLEYSLLLVSILYAMLYFSWSAFVEPSFAFSDVYVHHSWIYGLVEGKPFSAGIYPEGMHCVIYVINALFNIRIYSILLFIAGINIALIIVSAYCFMKYIFKWRYTSIFAITVFLTLEVKNMYLFRGMARAQCALPQEFSFPAIFICGLFLMRYLNSTEQKITFEKHKKWCINGELMIFIMAVATTITIHFYATFMALYLCVAVAVVYWKRVFRRSHFIPLVTAAILGLVIAAIPMGIGYASGIPIQNSLKWAVGLISDSAPTAEAEEPEIIFEESESVEELENSPQVNVDNSQVTVEVNDSKVQGTEAISSTSKPTLIDTIKTKLSKLINLVLQKLGILYESGYVEMYGKLKALLFVVLIIFTMLFVLVYRIIALFTKKDPGLFDNYMVVLWGGIIYAISFCAKSLGLPILLESDRSAFIGHFLMVMSIVIILDMICSFFYFFSSNDVMDICSVVTVFGLVAVICCTDNYHSYLFYEVSRFASTVNVTNSIIDSLPRDCYTIVSPVDELYQVMGHGRHEEILTLCEKQDRDEYILPTEYVFIYVEKKPIHYAQYLFSDGPKWLADDEYKDEMPAEVTSVTPNYITGQISEDLISEDIMYFAKASDSYLVLSSRTILMSKIYDWCQRFSAMYPNELKVYYEDDNFVCYYFKQNTERLYNLVIE